MSSRNGPFLFARLLSGLLIPAVGLVGIPPAAAADSLRGIEIREQQKRGGLEELEQSLGKGAGLEETLEELIQGEFAADQRLQGLAGRLQPADWTYLAAQKGLNVSALRGLAGRLGVDKADRRAAAEAILEAVGRANQSFAARKVSRAEQEAKQAHARKQPTSPPRLAPLPDPVRMIFSRHVTTDDAKWVAGRIQDMLSGIEPDRPIVIWLENAAPKDTPAHYPDFERVMSQIGITPAQLRAELSKKGLIVHLENALREAFQG